jgi:hypothetical protein
VRGRLLPDAPSELVNAEWEALRGSPTPLSGHDVDAGGNGGWVARRDGAVFVITPR